MVTGQPEGLDIGEAAERLGITVTALRKRIKRGSVYAYKVDDRWRVVLDGDQPGGQPGHPGAATGGDAHGQDGDQAVGLVYDQLVAQLRDENAYLRAELERERDRAARERERADTIIMHLSQRPIELQAPAPTANGHTPDVTTSGAATPAPPPRRWWQVWRF